MADISRNTVSGEVTGRGPARVSRVPGTADGRRGPVRSLHVLAPPRVPVAAGRTSTKSGRLSTAGRVLAPGTCRLRSSQRAIYRKPIQECRGLVNIPWRFLLPESLLAGMMQSRASRSRSAEQCIFRVGRGD